MKKRNITRSLFLLMICIVFIIGITLSDAGIEVEIQSGGTIETTDTSTKREFSVTHNMDVTYVQTSGEPEVILALDRSNSMLEEGYDGLPVAQTVWDSVNAFLDRYYTEYPTGKVAVISFGTNAVKSDNWKYYDNLADAKNEVAAIYAYDTGYEEIYEYVWKNNHWQKVLLGRDYTFYWLNWEHENGGTNLKEAFQYAEQTIWAKDKQREPYELMPNSVVVFSDGVPTHGGDKSEEDLLYPTTMEVSNIQMAIDAAKSLDLVANIVTVGYFEGIPEEDVKPIARQLLGEVQNGGFFEAASLDYIEPVFQAAQKGIKYVGTGAVVTETVQPEFLVDKNSILPKEGLTVRALNTGETQLTWDIGALKPEPYTFSYDITVRPNVLPTGDPQAKVNLNPELSYLDLYGAPVSHSLTEVIADIGPLDGVPYMTLRVEQLGSVEGGYLTGDDIILNHYLAYTNTEGYMFTNVDVRSFTKTNKTAFDNPFDVFTSGWSITGNKISTGINETMTVAELGDWLTWDGVETLTVQALVPGDFAFDHQLDYTQYDGDGNGFQGYFLPSEDIVKVKESTVTIEVVDPLSIPVRGAQIYLDMEPIEGLVTDDMGQAVITGLPTGQYHVGVKVPSGYEYNDILKNVEKGVVNDLVTLNYGSPTDAVNLTFDNIFVKDIEVAAADGTDFKAISDFATGTDAYVEFSLSIAYEYVELFLQDDHGLVNDLESTFVLSNVTDVNGAAVSGFVFDPVKNSLIFDGSGTGTSLPVGTYRANGQFFIPPTMIYPDNVTFINVDTVAVQNPTDAYRVYHRNLYSDGLTILIDSEGPTIATAYEVSVTPGQEIVVDVDIEDRESDIAAYYVLKGEFEDEDAVLAEVARLGLTESDGFYEETWPTTKQVVGNFEAQDPQDDIGEGYYEGSGEYTIYAVDAYGNWTVEVIFISVFSQFNDNI